MFFDNLRVFTVTSLSSLLSPLPVLPLHDTKGIVEALQSGRNKGVGKE